MEVQEAIDEIGFGRSQRRLLPACGVAFLVGAAAVAVVRACIIGDPGLLRSAA